MKARFFRSAEMETLKAADWYKERGPALGIRFFAAFRAAVAEIEDSPLLHREIEPGYRKCNLRRFPYTLIFRVTPTEIIVVAVAHQHQEPG